MNYLTLQYILVCDGKDDDDIHNDFDDDWYTPLEVESMYPSLASNA